MRFASDMLPAGARAAASRLATALGRRPAPPHDMRTAGTSPVALLPAARYEDDLADLVGRGLGLLELDLRGRRVLLKPNVVEYEAGTVINTNPAVIAGTALACLRAGAAEVVVAEGPGHRRDLEYLLCATGLLDALRDLRLRFVDLNLDDVRATPLGSRFTGLASLHLPVTVLRSDFIVSMPKLKTHHWAGMTASMKNLFGTVPGAVYGWPKNVLHHRGIDNSIVDLAATIRPHLAVVDGIVAMEGDGPIMGQPRALGVIAMGRDLAAVDATCARLIGVDPNRLPYLAMAGTFFGHIDERRIEQRGDPVARHQASFALIDAMQHVRLAGDQA